MSEQAPLDIKFKERFSGNLISNIVYFVVNAIIGIFLVPFFLDTLGPVAYAVIPLATTLTSYITILLTSINSSISRYLTLDLQRADAKSANITFNSSLFGVALVILLLLPVAVIVAWISPSIFNIGDLVAFDVFILFLCIFISVLIRTFANSFSVVLYAHNRMDLRNIVELTNICLQVGLIVLTFTVFVPSLPLVGIGYLAAAIFSSVIAYILAKKVNPLLHIRISSFSLKKFKEIGSLTFWAIWEHVGALLITNMGIILVNLWYGSIAETNFSIVVTLSTYIISTTSLLTSLFTPMIYAYRVRDDVEGLVTFTSISTKIVGLFTGLIIALVCVYSPQLLTYWVGPEYTFLEPLVWCILIPIVVFVPYNCFGSIVSAYLKVRPSAYLSMISGIFFVVLAYVLHLLFDIGYYSVALSYLITFILRNGVFGPMMIGWIVKVPAKRFIKPMFYGYGMLVVASIVGFGITQIISSNSLIGVLVSGGLLALTSMIIILKCILTSSEKALVWEIIPKGIKKFVPKWIL